MSDSTKINASKSTAYALGALAARLFEQYPDGHRSIGIKQPAVRVALDYVVNKARIDFKSYGIELNIDDNLFRLVQKGQKAVNKMDKESA